jgi:hypothetical protein
MGGRTLTGIECHPVSAVNDAASQHSSKQYFPKAFNHEQITILERLERPDVEGVVVQVLIE